MPSSVLYLILFEFYIVVAVPINKFYNFGIEHGDKELSKLQYQTSSDELKLKVPVKFYGESYSSLYINSNGLISFEVPLSQFANIPFPLEYPVLTAFYGTVDIRGVGNIYYRDTADKKLLERATREIQQAFPTSSLEFSTSNLIIVTWFRVGYFNQGTDKENTFQVVIATNGTESYVEFLYAGDGIQWLQGQGSAHTGLPDAKAQAGLSAFNGRIFMLPGSGTDQFRNLARLSNTNEAGVWMFRIGNIDSDKNVEEPNLPHFPFKERMTEKTCAKSYILCHSQATCEDFDDKFCCICRKGFFGNGFSCLKEGVPVRAIGKVNLDINRVKLIQQDVQVYVVVADGKVYMAISKVPESIGNLLQILYPITTMLNWLFAIPTSKGLNGFQITGGVLNHTSEIIYKETNDRVSVVQKFFGLDVFDQLKLDFQISGNVPTDVWDKLTVSDYQTQFNFISPGLFRSTSSNLIYKITLPGTREEIEKHISLEQTISFNESCSLQFKKAIDNVHHDQRNQYSYYRVKTARNFISYETRDNILRFAATSKVSLLTENEDPCIEGHVKCVANSSCVVEGDSFICLCNPGFRTTFAYRLTESGSNDFGCFDVNECAEGKANCHENAICVNEIGSYQCICKHGYSGNGFFCTEITSPCGNNFTLCNPPHSYCAVPNDYRTCNCVNGFHKRFFDDKQIAFQCVDVDECTTNPCGPNAYCINYEGSYTCECKNGYFGNGYQCIKTNTSCEIERNCSPNGECIRNETSQKFVCRCIKGYYGNGYQCRPYGAKLVIPAICEDTSCVCPPNFSVMKNLCVRNEYGGGNVTCNTLSSMCHPHAQCVFNLTANEHHCVCSAGYEGNGYDCTEIEVSCLKNDICDIHASCLVNNRTGKASCVCNLQYVGDGLTCSYTGACYLDADCGLSGECYYNTQTLTHECRCKKGFVAGEDNSCISVAQCPVCHQFASCIINILNGNSYCECAAGYRGDGVHSCEKIPSPCNMINNCSPFARCEYNLTTTMYECHCIKGYSGNGTYCFNPHSCLELPELCDTNARCLLQNHTYQCKCNPGFLGNGTSCSAVPVQEGGFLFVNWGTAILRVPYEPNITNPGYPIQLQANQIPIGLTIDCIRGRVYWSDYYGQKIKSSTFRGKNTTTVVEGNITSPEGVALDWLNQAIYWTDSGKKVIEAINLDGTYRRTVISNTLVNPRGIAVDPYRRKLFWSDWNRAQPKIEWSSLDGTNRSVFLDGPEVQLPNSVVVDPTTNELCWADAGTKRVMCASIENKQKRLVTDNCVSPFGLTVSSDKYYWTEKNLGKIGYYDKITKKSGNLTLPSVGTGTLYGIVNVPLEC